MYQSKDDYNTALKERRSVTAQAQQLLVDEARVSCRNGRTLESAIVYGTAFGGRHVGRVETYAKRETEAAIATRLALLEAADPSQQRPTPKGSTVNVDWIDN